MPPRRARAAADADPDAGSPPPRGRAPTRKRVTAVKSSSPSAEARASPAPKAARAEKRVASPAPAARTPAKKAAPAKPKPGGKGKQLALVLALALLGLLEAARRAGRSYIQSIMAGFEPGLPLPVTKSTEKLHRDLFVVDLHCDATFVPRDFLARANTSVCGIFHCERSHVDLPRMLEGNIGLQVLTAFSHVVSAPTCKGALPICDPLPVGNKRGGHDQITFAAPLAGYPLDAFWSRLHRVLTQAHRARGFEERSGGALRLLRSAPDLDAYVASRRRCLSSKKENKGKEKAPPGCGFSAALLGVEGSHALEGDISNLETLHDAGFRLMGLHHFHDNDAGGSRHGDERGGLSEWGRALVEELEERGWVVDLAHSAEEVVRDVLEVATKPIIVSHTGLRGVCPGERNLNDDTVHAIARTGGMVGIGFWSEATCGTTAKDIAKSIVYAVKLVGSEHVGLGSDWDGSVSMPPGLDAAGIAQVTEALIQQGVTGKDLENIMGLNALRVIGAALVPGRGKMSLQAAAKQREQEAAARAAREAAAAAAAAAAAKERAQNADA